MRRALRQLPSPTPPRAAVLGLALALALGCLVGGFGCKGSDATPEPKKGGGKGGSAFPVEVVTVEARRVDYTVTAVGPVTTFEQVKSASVAGAGSVRLARRRGEEGRRAGGDRVAGTSCRKARSRDGAVHALRSRRDSFCRAASGSREVSTRESCRGRTRVATAWPKFEAEARSRWRAHLRTASCAPRQRAPARRQTDPRHEVQP